MIAFDASTLGSGTSFAHTCTGSKLILLVAVATSSYGSGDATTVTYNGVALTKIANAANATSGYSSLWYLLNPPTGLHTVVVSGGSPEFIIAASYTGIKQSAQPDSYNAGSSYGYPTDFSLSTTVVSPGCWLVFTVNNGFGQQPLYPDSGVIRQQQRDGSYVGCNIALSDSNNYIPTGSQSLGINQNGSSAPWAGVIISLAPDSFNPSANAIFFAGN